ncbi:hypothetical protein F5876DRAFT_85095 [Lentinula aff. lateritia]|uniref:Uncharacterized protein n=1 Tax=Lentinula aff. lateritia TaxID=2804960 RepID=A0ACC1TG46_9AGAR|nr:hypothetical protein F5876DRAFT_85095 [Lentinula aff. lateritia]
MVPIAPFELQLAPNTLQRKLPILTYTYKTNSDPGLTVVPLSVLALFLNRDVGNVLDVRRKWHQVGLMQMGDYGCREWDLCLHHAPHRCVMPHATALQKCSSGVLYLCP